MEKKDNQSLGFGEIGTIRDILMGQQMAEYEKRFASMSQDLSVTTNDMNARINDLRENTWARLDSLEADIKARLDQLEKIMLEKFNQMDSKMAQTSNMDKANIGAMLAEMGKKLMGE